MAFSCKVHTSPKIQPEKMNRFPFLTYLSRKNAHCRPFFRNSCNGSTTPNGEGAVKVEPNLVQACLSYKVPQIKINQDGKFIHWKKAFQARFQNEKGCVGKKEHEADEVIVDDVDTDIHKSVYFDFSSFTQAQGQSSTDCAVCDETFASRRQLNEHKSLVHFPPYGTQKGFCYLPYFGEPKKFDKNKRQNCQLECSLCKKWFKGMAGSIETYLEGLKKKAKEKEESRRRGRKSKTIASRRRVCELCSKILSNRKGLERHMLIHTGEKPFPCNICGKPFRRKDNCVRHMKTAHLFKKPRKPRRRRSEMASLSSALAVAEGTSSNG